MGSMEIDPTTQSNYLDIATTHVELIWNIDFKAKIISGSARHSLLAKKDVDKIVLDTFGLNITNVQVDNEQVPFVLGEEHPVMGSPLSIKLSKVAPSGKIVSVNIDYSTSTKSTALQWLDAQQTQDKNHPYLFSQCQPIYARSLLPVQDTPSVKQTYSASVTSTLPVLLSAVRQSPPSTGPAHDGKEIGKETVVYKYEQPVPIPSYLIAIAVGDVRYRPFPVKNRNWTSGVWAEPSIVDFAYDEFNEDTITYLSAAEDTLTPYRFSVYDLLVLPPSFPYGGMENACLTFLTPTVLTGDHSLNDVVAHELVHSWFGNGVTHKTATSFFLNEGWTTYTERYLLQTIKGPQHRGFSFIIGYKGLVDDLIGYENRPKYQRLVIDFEKGEDPDDAYSQVPYEKGANLILHIERTLGGVDVLLPYMKNYVNTFTGKSISAIEWKENLYEYFQKNNPEKVKLLDTIDWQTWFYGEGITLPVEMKYDTTLAEQTYQLAAQWDSFRGTPIADLPFKSEDLSKFNGNQIVVFLERLSTKYEPLPSNHIHHMADIYSLNTSPNAEIRLRWYELALSSPAAKDFIIDAANWLVRDEKGIKGRMKFCRPTFRAIYKIDVKLAQETFLAHEFEFHPIAAAMIKKDIGLA